MFNIKNLDTLRTYSSYPDDSLGLFLLQMIMLFKPKNIVETGFYNGYGSIFMAKGIQLLKNSGKIISIDINEKAKKQYDIYVKGNKLDDIIKLIIKDSAKALVDVKAIFNNGIDLLFIDGDHSYEGCKKDWLTYNECLNKGSVILIHDFTLPGVNKCIQEIKQHVSFHDEYDFMHFPIYHNMVVMRKKDYVLKKQEGQVAFNLDIMSDIINFRTK